MRSPSRAPQVLQPDVVYFRSVRRVPSQAVQRARKDIHRPRVSLAEVSPIMPRSLPISSNAYRFVSELILSKRSNELHEQYLQNLRQAAHNTAFSRLSSAELPVLAVRSPSLLL